MLLKRFFEKKDFDQYPYNEYEKHKDFYGTYLTRIYPHLFYAYTTKYWWDNINLQMGKVLLYNNGVLISFADNYIKMPLIIDDLLSVSKSRVHQKFFKLLIFNNQKMILSDIPFKIDGEDFNLPIDDAFISVTNNDVDVIRDEGSVTIVNNSGTGYGVELIFNQRFFPEYSESFKLRDKFSDTNCKFLIYNDVDHFIMYNNITERFELQSEKYMKSQGIKLIELMKPYSYYLNKNLLIESDVLALFFKPNYYFDDGDYVMVQSLDLMLMPLEDAYVEFNENEGDIISLGAFHRLNPKTNHYRLFKTSVPFPGYCEHTIYRDCSISTTYKGIGLIDKINKINKTEDKSKKNGIKKTFKFEGDLYNYSVFPYPLFMLLYDYTYLSNKGITGVDEGGILCIDYATFDLNKIIYLNDFNPLELDVHINGTISELQSVNASLSDRTFILYNLQEAPILQLSSTINIVLDNTKITGGIKLAKRSSNINLKNKIRKNKF